MGGALVLAQSMEIAFWTAAGITNSFQVLMSNTKSTWSCWFGLMIGVGLVFCRRRLVSMWVEVLFKSIEGNRSFSGRRGGDILESEPGPSFTIDKANETPGAGHMPIG